MNWAWPSVGGASGGGSSRESILQPLNDPANIVAAYALNEPAAACNTDRSGNGRNFVTAGFLASDMANAYDLIPGKACIWTTGPYPTAPVQCRQLDAAWGHFTQFTLAHRVFVSVPETGAPGLIEHCFGQAQGTPPGAASVAFQWGIIGNGANPHCLYYFAETAAKVGIPFISNLFVSPNTWHFITVRRLADNSVILGVDGVYEASGALAAPGSVAAAPRYVVFGAHQDNTVPAASGLADWIFWSVAQSDAFLAAQQAPAMAGRR